MLIPPSLDRVALKILARSRVKAPSVARLRFTPSTTLAPCFQASIIAGIRRGGCCRSASMVTTASPLARLSPASSAASLPKLRLKRTPRMRASCAASSRKRSKVRSLLPSSTTMISQSMPQVARIAWMTDSAWAMPDSSLWAGITTLSNLFSGFSIIRLFFNWRNHSPPVGRHGAPDPCNGSAGCHDFLARSVPPHWSVRPVRLPSRDIRTVVDYRSRRRYENPDDT